MIISGDTVTKLDELDDSIRGFYDEFSILSKKKPDSPSNEFKIELVNDVIEQINEILGEGELPLRSFKIFNSTSLPFVSDVVLVLDQYIKCIDRIRSQNTESNFWVDAAGRRLKRTRFISYKS